MAVRGGGIGPDELGAKARVVFEREIFACPYERISRGETRKISTQDEAFGDANGAFVAVDCPSPTDCFPVIVEDGRIQRVPNEIVEASIGPEGVSLWSGVEEIRTLCNVQEASHATRRSRHCRPFERER